MLDAKELHEALRLGLKAYNEISALSCTDEFAHDIFEAKDRLRALARKAGMDEQEIRRA